MVRSLLYLTLALGAAASAPAAPAPQVQRGPGARQQEYQGPTTLRDMLAEVEDKEDAVDRRIFGRIASLGTEESFRGLSRVIGSLRSEFILGTAYQAYLQYRGKPELESKSIKHLHDEALRNRRVANQRAAVRALTRFGSAAESELESIFRVQLKREKSVATIAFQALIPSFGAHGNAKAAGLIITHGELRTSQQEEVVRTALLQCKDRASLRVLGKHLVDRKTSTNWKILLVDLLVQHRGEDVDKALVGALKAESAAVRTRAIEALGLRQDRSLIPKLQRHLDADDASELRAAVQAVCRLAGDDARWAQQLLEMADDKRPEARMGAAVGLLETRTPEAVEALHALLADEDWRVRAEAIQQVGNLHRAASVPHLVSRLDVERGRLRQDLTLVLRLMTGLDHGANALRWREWWKAEGDGFVLPTYEVALAREKERKARLKTSQTQVTFYGLRVVSDRLAFVVDISGSMAQAANLRDGRSSVKGSTKTTRLDVAKRELRRTLTGLSPGVLFNLVFFSSGVGAWQDGLIEVDEKVRAEALEFVERQGAWGGTNIYDAIMAVFDDPRVDTLYLLSDGAPSAGTVINSAQILERVLRLNAAHKIRIHCIAIGQKSPLMRGLAEGTGGTYVEFL